MTKETENELTRSDDERDYQDKIYKTRDYAAEQFDKLIVYLSSGALVLTIGFVKDIVKVTKQTNTTALKWSWGFFCASLFFILISHQTSMLSADKEVEEKFKFSKIMNYLTHGFNWFSIMALSAGIIAFIIFISKNL